MAAAVSLSCRKHVRNSQVSAALERSCAQKSGHARLTTTSEVYYRHEGPPEDAMGGSSAFEVLSKVVLCSIVTETASGARVTIHGQAKMWWIAASTGNVGKARVPHLWIHKPAMHQVNVQQVKDGDGICVLQSRRLVAQCKQKSLLKGRQGVSILPLIPSCARHAVHEVLQSKVQAASGGVHAIKWVQCSNACWISP